METTMPAPPRFCLVISIAALAACGGVTPFAAAAGNSGDARRPSTQPATQPVVVTEEVEAGVLEDVIVVAGGKVDPEGEMPRGVVLRVPRKIADPIREENDQFRIQGQPNDPFGAPWFSAPILVSEKGPCLFASEAPAGLKFSISRGGKDLVKPMEFQISAKADSASVTPDGQKIAGRVELKVPRAGRTYVIGFDALVRTRKHPQTRLIDPEGATITWRYPAERHAAPETRPVRER
jgi:hypothetical protein